MGRFGFAVVLMCAAVVTTPELAAQTLDKIRKEGAINLAVRDSSIPFSYFEPTSQKSVGYSIEVCNRVVDAVKAELGMPNLQVRQVLVDSNNRMEAIETGRADLSCGSATNTVERQKRVAFSTTYFVAGGRLLARKSSNINSFADMKGKAVVSTFGTTSKDQLAEINTAQGLGMRLLNARDHAEAFLMVESGRAQAFYMDGMILFGVLASSRASDAYAITQDSFSAEPYGLMMRRGDPAFKKLVDGVVTGMLKNGEMEKLYSKWFLEPIPPKGQVLNQPLSPSMKKLFANPTDSGNQKDY